MNTPIVDFVKSYNSSDISRLHMPGHKGKSFLGCEKLDITEIENADSLYEANGIIAQSEANACSLFGSASTLYSCEGSSQCIRAMLFLSLQNAPKTNSRPLIFASRNAHKTFISASALLDIDVFWLWQHEQAASICACNITSEILHKALSEQSVLPFAVYITSPDYLGNMLDIKALSAVCKQFNVPLLVDNAHGAYHQFLPENCHAISQGATICCNSAHKTLPVLTGGAYLHISKTAPANFAQNAKKALALFGSTSPSYLVLQSLDLCNSFLENGYKQKLTQLITKIERLKHILQQNGYIILKTEPLKLTIHASAVGCSGCELSSLLRQNKVECEYADPDFLVLMFTPQNKAIDFKRIASALNTPPCKGAKSRNVPQLLQPQKAISIRAAMFVKSQEIAVEQSLDRICASPSVSCPPAIPIVISGEIINAEAVSIFKHYGIKTVSVVCE